MKNELPVSDLQKRSKRWGRLMLAWCLWGTVAGANNILAQSPADAASSVDDPGDAISAALFIPSTISYVIGDDIPLNWRFFNASSEPMAFMWEGCCRLNGSLSVTRGDEGLDPIPPGSSMAHMFARAAVVQPGMTQEFNTMLSDWVELKESGRYDLQGRYVGVMPSQTPQVPSGIALWRGETKTQPIAFSVLKPVDYLKQGETRHQQGGLKMILDGPSEIPALESATYTVSFENLTDRPLSLPWPSAWRIWLIDEDGRRVGRHQLASEASQLEVPAAGTAARQFTLNADAFLDAPLGHYRLFVDHPANDVINVRIPSSSLPIHWNLDADKIKDLIIRAAQGPKTAFRNPALKLLRVYLGQISTLLTSMTWHGLPEKASLLGQELTLASRLKTVSPSPGQMTMGTTVSPQGIWSFEEEKVRDVLADPAIPFADQLGMLLKLRRHLGWTVHLEVHPAGTLKMGPLMAGVSDLSPMLKGIGGAVRVPLPNALGTVTNMVLLKTAPGPANLVYRVDRPASGFHWGVARQLPDPANPQMTAFFKPEAYPELAYQRLAHPGELRTWLSDGKLSSMKILILVDPAMNWEEVMGSVRPLLELGQSMDLGLMAR